MSRLRTYAPMKRRSAKVQKSDPDFQAVYRLVDQRSERRCEYAEYVEYLLRYGLLGPLGIGPSDKRIEITRCPRRATDHHHLLKPRRAHHNENAIVHLCRDHHDRCEWPYKRGRLVVTALGSGRFGFAIKYAADKFAARETV